jgi:1-acyl-sn-glycerol-3-phosphate acyltransferase
MAIKPLTEPDPGATGRHFNLGLPPVAYRALRSLAHGANRGLWRVTVEGASVVPATGPVILAPVHRSNIDFLVASEVTRRKLFYMAKDSLWKAPRFGTFLESIGAFPVNREGADRLALDRAQNVLEDGEALILFPEGTRKEGPVVGELHEGAAFLAARTGAPIVPIGIGGSAAAMPKGSKMVRPVKIHVVVGPPLAAPERSARGRVPRHQVHELTERLRTELQALYTQAQERVGHKNASSGAP